MKTLIATLAISSALALPNGALGGTIGAMTLKEFKEHNESAQTYMVVGAWALAETVGVKCRTAVTIREWHAGLLRPSLDAMQPWIKVLGDLMDERECKVEQGKGDT